MGTENPVHADKTAEQRRLAQKVVLRDCVPAVPDLVGGTDVSYFSDEGDGPVYAIAGVVLLRYGTWEAVEKWHAVVPVDMPYISGLLSYRELPALLQAAEQISARPDVWLVDGAGIAHPRGLGLAAHFGVVRDEPSVGVAKKRLTGYHEEVASTKGAREPLKDRDARVVGSVVRTRDGVKPLFVSPGNRVDVERAVELVLSACTRYRLPEPTRMAHRFVTSLREHYRETGIGRSRR
ncbi:MAG: endonuclease V [Synergistales bacterium]|nr:endonuclease V [Synergistales bacterium]